jgi:hypothetical protein
VDLGDVAAVDQAVQVVPELVSQMDHEVHGHTDGPEQRLRRDRQSARAGQDQHPSEHLVGRVGVHGADRAGPTGVHRLQHRHQLVPAHLADHDAAGVEAQGVLDELVQGDRAEAFGVALAGLQREHVAVPVGLGVEEEFVLLLHGGDPLVGVDLGGQGTGEGGLAVAHSARDHDVLVGTYGGGQKRPAALVEGAGRHQVVQVGVEHAVPTDRQAGARCDTHDRGDARAPH